MGPCIEMIVIYFVLIAAGVYILASFVRNKRAKTHAIETIERTGYFDGFNNIDIRVRGCESLDQCKARYFHGIRAPKLAESIQLGKLSKIVDKHLIDKGYMVMAHRVPWNFMFFDPVCEAGFPHTHGSLIFLPYGFLGRDKDWILNTLLHEKVHVYQRMFPLQTTSLYLDYWKMEILGVQSSLHASNGMERSNPDANRVRFIDGQGKPIGSDYIDEARTLADIRDPRDHPNEMMAYSFASLVMSKDDIKNRTQKQEQLANWASYYLSP